MAERKRLGDLLVEAKVISTTQLQAALGHQRQWGGKLGTSLIEMGFLTEDVLAKFLSFQLNYPSVSLAKLKVTPDVLAKIPRDMQEKHLCVPIAVIKEGRRESLVVAMSDPTDVRALDEISFRVGGKVKPVIATEGSLKHFLFGGTSRASGRPHVGGDHTEHTDEFEVIRGTMTGGAAPSAASGHTPAGGIAVARTQGGHAAVGASHAPVGEHTVDLDEPQAEILLEETVEPSGERTAPPAPAARPAPPAANPSVPPAGEGDSFASLLRANASGAPSAAAPPPAVPAGPGAAALDSLFANSPSEPIPDEDHTEPDIQIAPRPPATASAAPPPPWQSAPPQPPTPEVPAVEDWTGATTPGGPMPVEDSVPEISLPGPEPSAIPADLAPNLAAANPLLEPEPAPPESPSRIFSVPADLMMEAPPPPADPVAPPPEEPPVMAVTESEAPAAPAWEAPVESWGMAEEAPPAEAPPPIAEPSHPEDHEPTIPMQDPVPAMQEIGPMSSDAGGAVPSVASLDPAEMERTILGPGASEPTWADETDAPARPDRTRLTAVPPVETSVPEYTATRESPLHDPPTADALSTAQAWGGETEPGVPEPEPAPAAPLPAPEPPAYEAEAWSAQPGSGTVEMPIESAAPEPAPAADPPESSESGRLAAAASSVSEEQAALNSMVTKKLKLLNAITEILLEKGLITEDEIKDKVSKKKG